MIRPAGGHADLILHLGARYREVGLTRRRYARLLRFRRALELLQRRTPLSDAALAAGYYDQPHMNADCTEFAGMTPGAIAWLQRVLGANAEHVHEGPGNTVVHAELWFGAACVMAGSLQHGSLPPRPPGTGVVYVVLPEPAAVDCAAPLALAAGPL